jgi:hypothetical protein
LKNATDSHDIILQFLFHKHNKVVKVIFMLFILGIMRNKPFICKLIPETALSVLFLYQWQRSMPNHHSQQSHILRFQWELVSLETPQKILLTAIKMLFNRYITHTQIEQYYLISLSFAVTFDPQFVTKCNFVSWGWGWGVVHNAVMGSPVIKSWYCRLLGLLQRTCCSLLSVLKLWFISLQSSVFSVLTSVAMSSAIVFLWQWIFLHINCAFHYSETSILHIYGPA